VPRQDEAKLICSFCGKSQHQVRKLIAGPTVYICDECIKLCNDITAAEAERTEVAPDNAPANQTEANTSTQLQLLCCSFCGKNQREVKRLIAGPTVYICDECIGLCNDIIAEEIDREERAGVLRAKLPGEVRALIAGILERGLPAAARIHDIRNEQIIEETRRRRAAREPSDELLWLPWSLAVDWRDLHDIVARAGREQNESGEGGPPVAELPGRISPITERLAGTLEVLDVLARSLETLGPDEVRQLGPSVTAAAEKLREARELLVSLAREAAA